MIELFDRFKVNISLIDEQHKKLFGLIDETGKLESFSNNPKSALKIIAKMTEYAREHFGTEEHYMKEFNFPGLESHRNEHIDFINTITDYKSRAVGGDSQIINEILDYLIKWLINHIQVTDKEYIDCFKKNGL
jgi:hemerythrin-like metal-binding protein